MTYQPPVREHAFILRDDGANIDQHGDLPGFADALVRDRRTDSRGRRPVHRRGPGPAEPRRRQAGLRLEQGLHGQDAGRLQGGLQAAVRRRLDGAGLGPGLWRSGPAATSSNLSFSEMSSSANMAFSMYPGLAHGAYSAIHTGGTDAQKEHLPAEDGVRRVDRHHEPDRAAAAARTWACCAPRRFRRLTAAIASPARRSGSRPANTTWPTTSSTWCWPASRAPWPA